MISQIFKRRVRMATLQVIADTFNVPYNGNETVGMLEDALATAGVSLATQPAIASNLVQGATSDPTVTADAAGNITSTGLVLPDPRLTLPMKAGQRVDLLAGVLMGFGSGTGTKEAAASFAISSDAGTTWALSGRLMTAKFDAAFQHTIPQATSYAAPSDGTYVFGIKIGNIDNLSAVRACSNRRWLSYRVF